jgi:protein-disulfide isomerase
MTEEITQSETGAQAKSETITLKKNDLWKYSTFVLLAILVIGGLVVLSGGSGNPTAAAVGANQPSPSAPTPSATAKVDLNKVEHFLGDKDAEVVLVEWTDFECPFCGRHNEQTFGQIKTNYIDTGKIKYGLENFPLSFHPNAQKAAEAFECAAKVGGEGAGGQMHGLLFKKGVSGGVSAFKGYASEIGLDQSDFDACLDSGEMAGKVQADLQEGQAAGVRGTPGFAVVAADGTITPISGAQPYAIFDEALQKAGA